MFTVYSYRQLNCPSVYELTLCDFTPTAVCEDNWSQWSE